MGFCFVVMSDCKLSCVVYVYCEIIYCSVFFKMSTDPVSSVGRAHDF